MSLGLFKDEPDLNQDPRARQAAMLCARDYLAAKNWPRALPAFEELAWNLSNDPLVLEQLATCYEKTAQPHKALPALQLARTFYRASGRNLKYQQLAYRQDQLEAVVASGAWF